MTENITQNNLEYLITKIPYDIICIISKNPSVRGSRYSYTPLYQCLEGVGSPEVRGFKNGKYAGILFMPTKNNEESVVYFTVLRGEFNVALEDEGIITRLINSNALFPEKRTKKLVYSNEIKGPFN